MSNFIDLRISGIGLDFQEITRNLSMKPNYSYKKGDVVFSKVPGIETIHKEDLWIAGIEIAAGKTIEQTLAQFLKQLIPAARYLKKLAIKYEVTVWVSAYPETEQINVHLSPQVIHDINEIGASFDCGVMFLKQFYDGQI